MSVMCRIPASVNKNNLDITSNSLILSLLVLILHNTTLLFMKPFIYTPLHSELFTMSTQ